MLGAERIGAPVGKVKVFKSFVATLGILNEIDKSEYSFVDLFMSGSALSLCPVWKICNFQFSKRFEPSAPEPLELHHRRRIITNTGPSLSKPSVESLYRILMEKNHHESP